MSGPRRLTLEEILGEKAAAEMREEREAEAVEEAALAEKVMASVDPIAVAVRGLHRPGGGKISGQQCEGCWEECLYCYGDHEWPCETVLVVGRALP